MPAFGWAADSALAAEASVLPGGALRRSRFLGQKLTTKRRVFALGAAALLSLLVLGVFYYAFLTEVLSNAPDVSGQASGSTNRKYGVVIDAGSSGSRAMIYAWDDPKQQQYERQKSNLTGLPAVGRAGEQWTFKTVSGISSFANRARMVGVEHIKPLLDFAQTHIPGSQIRQTPVYLLATAGMRLVDKARRTEILDNACSYAREHYDFLLPDCRDSFQVVSGELEGLYGWVAVNYLMGGFTGTGPSHGFLDMGGASAQIAFEPAQRAARLHQQELAKVTLRNLDGSDRVFDVFVATFLGHGTNEARRRYVEQLRATVPVSQADGAALQSVDDPCLAPGLTLPTIDGRVVLRGSGDFTTCVKATEPLLNKTICPIEPCLFAGVHAPEIDFGTQRFVGVSEYWYSSHDYLGLGGVWDIDKFESKATRFCKQHWSYVSKLVPNDSIHVGRLQMQCFKAAWLVNVLHKGFGAPRQQQSPFESVNEIDGVEVSWTLGALLLKMSATIPPNQQTASAKTYPGIELPSRSVSDSEQAELVDDSLWSPLQFAGVRRLIVLWQLQPNAIRMVIIFVFALAFCLLAVIGALPCVHHMWKSRKPRARAAAAAADALSSADRVSSRGMPHERCGDDNGDDYQLTYSPTMFALDIAAPVSGGLSQGDTDNVCEVSAIPQVISRQLDSAPSSPSGGGGGGEHRALSNLLAEEESPMSRSSSVQNLSMLNRRRGGG